MSAHNTSLLPHRHLLILFLFSALLLLPTVLFGAGGGDMLAICMTAKLFAAQFWHGDLYPRWLQNLFAGNGGPVFFYYPPLAYFITSFFILLSPLDSFGYYPIAASAWLAVFIGGVNFYCWMKDEKHPPQAALVGSLLYMSAPYLIAQHFYYLALFCSIWAWAWLPLLLMYARHTVQNRPYAIVKFSLTLAALILTNAPMTIIFGPMAIAYGALYVDRATLLKQIAALGLATFMGFALTAVFLIPAAMYLDYSLAKTMWSSPLTDYHHYFIKLDFENPEQAEFTIGFFIMAILTLTYGVVARGKPKQYLFFVLASLAGLFMTTAASRSLWEMLPVLKALQLPERLFMVPSLCLAVLAVITLSRLRWLAYSLMAMYIACAFLASMSARTPQEELRKSDHVRYEKFILNITYPGFLTSLDLARHYAQDLWELDSPHAKVVTISGDATAEVTQWRPRDIALHYKADKASVLRVGQFYYPGFLAFEGDTILDTSRDADTGQVLIDVPPGEGNIALILTALIPEILGKIISSLSAAVLVLGFLLELKHRKTLEVKRA